MSGFDEPRTDTPADTADANQKSAKEARIVDARMLQHEFKRRVRAERQLEQARQQLESERGRVQALTEAGERSYDLNARRRKIKFWLLFSLGVTVPTVVTGAYNFVIASDRYVSETTFSVYSEEKGLMTAEPALAALGLADPSNKRDLLVLKAFMESQGMLDKLDSRLHVKDMFRRPGSDFWERMPEEVSRDEYLKYYLRRSYVELDQDAGVLTYHVNAFRPEDSHAIASAVLDISEQFINDMMSRIRRDDLKFAADQLQESEAQLTAVLQELNTFRKKNNNLDPAKAGEGLLAIMQGLETERIKASADLSARGKVMTATSHDIKALKYKINALTQEIDKQKAKLVGDGADPLSDVMQDYQGLLIKQDFKLKRYTVALSSFEAATVAASRKSKYIVRVTNPEEADRSALPLRATNTATALVVSLVGVSLLSLFAAGVRDHVSAA